jgi:hypothetical protein
MDSTDRSTTISTSAAAAAPRSLRPPATSLAGLIDVLDRVDGPGAGPGRRPLDRLPHARLPRDRRTEHAAALGAAGADGPPSGRRDGGGTRLVLGHVPPARSGRADRRRAHAVARRVPASRADPPRGDVGGRPGRREPHLANRDGDARTRARAARGRTARGRPA